MKTVQEDKSSRSTWRPLPLIVALVLANLLVWGALDAWAFSAPAPLPPTPIPQVTFTPNPAFSMRLLTPTATPFPTLIPPPTLPPQPDFYEFPQRGTHGRR